MYVDPSAIVAILKEEEDAAVFRERIAITPNKTISVVGKFEAAISIGRAIQDHELGPKLVERFCNESGIVTVAVPPELFADAVDAFRRYGKGCGHPAKLNFGDCFSYAFAKRHGLPLLFKGNDFSKTDVVSAI